jgi:microcystin-dependent protein
MSCTAADLINIQPLTLSDTFHTWFDRTNEVIDVLSGVNILSVEVGQTSGLYIETGCSGGYYNGVITIDTNVGGGIGNGVPGYRPNHIVMDFSDLIDATGGISGPAPSPEDYVLFSDISDLSLNATTGTPKKIQARYMLPNQIVMGGDGTLEIDGDVTIVGNFNYSGELSFIDANDLRIEDKVIELAYARYTSFMIEGNSSGDINNLAAGATVYYRDGDEGGYTTVDASTIGYIRTVVQRTPAGPTAQIQLHSFDIGGVNDIELNGRMWVGTPASGTTFDVITTPVPTEDFYSDDLLQPAGIAIKGLSGDKTFLWYKNYNGFSDGFLTNKNLGVSGESLSVNTSYFESVGYPTRSNMWTFLGASGSSPKITLATGEVTGSGEENSSWSFTKKNTPAHSKKNQILSLTHYVGPTGYDEGQQTITIADIIAGPSGTTFPGVPVYDWAKFLNVDQLDGAHGTTNPTAWSIPIALADNKIHPDWVDAGGLRKIFNVPGHAFYRGDIVRYDEFNGLTFARANTIPTAEALGVVSYIDGNKVTVTTKGFVSGITDGGLGRIAGLGQLVTGHVYYLSPTTNGGMIADPDTGATQLNPGEVRKAVFLSLGGNASSGYEGYVVNYTGVVYAEDVTDEVYIPSLAPAGSIMPFAGPIEKIPYGWLLCDGRIYGANEYSELYTAVQSGVTTGISVYYITGTKASNTSITLPGSTRGILTGDLIHLKWGASSSGNVVVTGVNTTTKTISFAAPADFSSLANGTEVRVHGRAGAGGRSTFFVPDLRGKTIFGTSSYGDGVETAGLDPSLARGELGGQTDVALKSENLPPHSHGTFDQTVIVDGVGAGRVGNSTSTNTVVGSATGDGESFEIFPPFVSMHWIIRYRKGVSATVLSGHDHDNRYIRYDAAHVNPVLTTGNKNQFHTNAAVLSDGTLGRDKFENSLSIQHVGSGITSDDWTWWTNGIPTSYQFVAENSSGQWNNSALNVMGGDASRAAINIFNNNTATYSLSGSPAYADAMSLNFWGVGISGATAPARYISGIRANITNLGPNYASANERNRRYMDFVLGGITDGRAALAIYRDENPADANGNTQAGWVRSIRFVFPTGVTSAPVHTGQMKHLMLRGETELVEYTGTSLSGSDIHTTGSVTLRGSASMDSSQAGSDTSILTVDINSGSVARRKMYQVASTNPPTSTDGYPEGFVWYNDTDTTPAPDGSKIPLGGIIMWSGAIANIPFGYRLCDGSGGTPDLRDRFIVGAGGLYGVGASGGAASVQLSVTQIPDHRHGIARYTGAGNNDLLSFGEWSAGVGNGEGRFSTRYTNGVRTTTLPGDGSGGHDGGSVNPNDVGANPQAIRTYGVSDLDSTQSPTSHENRPPFYALAYIMRIA